MPRKLRLSVHRKNEFRKKRERTVTIQQAYTAQFVSQSASPLTGIHFVAELPSQASTSLSQTSSLQIPQPVLDVLKVSIPMEILLDCKAPSVMRLHERINTLSVLPYGMSLVTCP